MALFLHNNGLTRILLNEVKRKTTLQGYFI